MQNILKRMSSFVVAIAMCIGLASVVNVTSTRSIIADAATADSYYSGISATRGTELLGQLHDLITTTHTTYTTYGDCKEPDYVVKTDPGSSSSYVMEFYSQADISKAWDGNSAGTWNREHVWPKSLSNGLWEDINNSGKGGGADMHHIRPAEVTVNSKRGNNKFGVVSGGESISYKSYPAGKRDNSTFEPIDDVKGDVARIVMYVYTHYNKAANVGGSSNDNGYFGTLNFKDIMDASSESAAISLLLDWNRQDPVDNIEKIRNDAVFELQHNRNPFIDNENYAEAIWGSGTVTPNPGGDTTDEVTGLTLSSTSFTLSAGATKSLTVTATPSSASNAVTWSSNNTTVATVSGGVVTAKIAGTATITATSTKNTQIKATATVTVTQSSTTTPTGKTLAINGDTLDMLNSSANSGYDKYNGTHTINGYSVTTNQVMVGEYSDSKYNVLQFKKSENNTESSIKVSGNFSKIQLVIDTSYETLSNLTVMAGSTTLSPDSEQHEATGVKKDGKYDITRYTVDYNVTGSGDQTITIKNTNTFAIYAYSITLTEGSGDVGGGDSGNTGGEDNPGGNTGGDVVDPKPNPDKTDGTLAINSETLDMLNSSATSGYDKYNGTHTINGYSVTTNQVMVGEYSDNKYNVVQFKKSENGTESSIKVSGNFSKIQIVIDTSYETLSNLTVMAGSTTLSPDSEQHEATGVKKDGKYDITRYTVEYIVTGSGVQTITIKNDQTFAIYAYSITLTEGSGNTGGGNTGDSGNTGSGDNNPGGNTGGETNSNLELFSAAVSNIVYVGSYKDRLESLNNAIIAYSRLNESEKLSALEDVWILIRAIDEFNGFIRDLNKEAQTTNSALMGG